MWMKVEGVFECVTPGLPSHDCILLVELKIGAIGCVIAAAGVSRVLLTSFDLAQGILQLAGSPQAIVRVTGRTSPGAPLKIWGEERPRPARVDTPAQNYAQMSHQ